MSEGRQVSATILTKNSGERFAARLTAALQRFDEIVVLDNGSTDNTIEIAGEFENVSVYISEFIGFGPLKNLAASHARNDLVFTVDSDEIVSDELTGNILSSDLKPDEIGEVHRMNFYGGRPINGCGWQNDLVMRLLTVPGPATVTIWFTRAS